MERDSDIERGPNSALENASESDGLRNGNVADAKRQSFAKRLHAVSMDKPPATKPIGFSAGVLTLFCCVLPAAGCGICCLIALTLVVNFLPIATIVIGVVYKDKENCPSENIATLLIVGGSLTLVETILTTVGRVRSRGEAEDGEVKMHPCITFLRSLVRLASFVWFIAACVIIYRLYPHVSYVNDADESTPVNHNYCHPVLYKFAFWLITSSFIIMGVALALICCSSCVLAFTKA